MAKVTRQDIECVDFTRDAEGFHHLSGFDERVISLIRQGTGKKVLVVVDRGFCLPKEAPHIVLDHLNLSGTNPLVGPNDSCGERFPSVNNVYITDVCPNLPRVVVAGLKPGVFPTREEMSFIASLGAQCCCYNLVPTMIVAAHAGWKVLGIVVPEAAKLQPVMEEVLAQLVEVKS